MAAEEEEFPEIPEILEEGGEPPLPEVGAPVVAPEAILAAEEFPEIPEIVEEGAPGLPEIDPRLLPEEDPRLLQTTFLDPTGAPLPGELGLEPVAPIPSPEQEPIIFGAEEFPEIPEILEEDLPPLQGIETRINEKGQYINVTSAENFRDVIAGGAQVDYIGYERERGTVGRGATKAASRVQTPEESLDALADRALESPVVPEEIMGPVTAQTIMAMRKMGTIDYDMDTDSYWYIAGDSSIESRVNPVRLSMETLEDIARDNATSVYNAERERVVKVLRKRGMSQERRATELYGFMRTYYPSVADQAIKDSPFLQDYDFAGAGEPWYASLNGLLNVLDMTLMGAMRKGSLEFHTKAHKERVTEGQFELPGGLEEDYLKTNGGYKMANGNYLLPVAGRGSANDPDRAPDEWPEDLNPTIRPNLPMGEWPEEWAYMSGTESVQSMGVPGTKTINGVMYSVIDPKQFRGVLMEDLHNHVSLTGKLKAPLRAIGAHRGFTDIDPGEAWRELGFRRYMRGGLDKQGNPYLTGEHFPGYQPNTKIVDGVEVMVPWTEDLAKVASMYGASPAGGGEMIAGASISDEVAYESAKDISAIGALPWRGLQGIIGTIMAAPGEASRDIAELIWPKGEREAAGEHDPLIAGGESWNRAEQALAELLETGAGAKATVLGGETPEEYSGAIKYDPEAGVDPAGNLPGPGVCIASLDPKDGRNCPAFGYGAPYQERG